MPDEAERMMNAALEYANLGLAVFPLFERDKRPAVKNGFKVASTHPENITEAWGSRPYMNIGIACGDVSGGLVAIDLDVDDDTGKDGVATLRAWEHAHGELPETASVVTGSGGMHLLYFTQDDISSSVNADVGVDIRANGGYIVAPPSIHPNGREYEFEQYLDDVPIAIADDNVLAFIKSVQKERAQGEHFELPDKIDKGGRNDILFKYACSLQEGGYTDGYIRSSTHSVNVTKCDIPLPDTEVDKIVDSALRYEKGVPKPDDPDKNRDDVLLSWPAIEHPNIKEPPSRAPVLIDGILRLGHKLLLTAPSKAGKTWAMIQLAEAVATGGIWMGWKCEKGCVLYVNFEVDDNSFINRLAVVADATHRDLDEVSENLYVWNLRGKVNSMQSFTTKLIEATECYDFALVILDPLYKLQEGDENSARDVRVFWNQVDRICTNLGCAVATAHHHSKGAKGDVAAIDRGSGSGVFARDPDAILDMVEIFPPNLEDDETIADLLHDPTGQASAWRLSSGGLREFPAFEPREVMFKYPRHYIDLDGITRDWEPIQQNMMRQARKAAGKASGEARKEKAELARANTETVLLQYFYSNGIGREGIQLNDAVSITGLDPKTLKKYVRSGELFDIEPVNHMKTLIVPKHPFSLEFENA